jgi:geranylgeranyl diphosphate synthase type I
MEFQEKLLWYKKKIDTHLKEFLEGEKQKAPNSYSKKIYEFILDYVLRGGKRIRPILFIEGYRACDGNDVDEIVKASLAVELLEGYLLIHDDIIDRDEVRRGGPSFHELTKVWYKEEFSDKDSEHFGVAFAILAGDMLGSLAIKPIADANFDNRLKLRAIEELIQAEKRCYYGELHDVILEKQDNVTEEDLFSMIGLKTASYTTEAPLVMGAVLGDGKDEQVDTLRKYGKLIGEAFQIIDDMLGTFGDAEKTGKPIDSDIKEGKKTLLIIHALQKANEEDRKFLRECLGNMNLRAGDLDRIKEIMVKTGAVDYSREMASSLVAKTKRILENADLEPDSKKFFFNMADFILERNM